MSRSLKVLEWVMRIAAVVLLTAVIPAVIPFAWMQHIHQSLGMGELPERPIVAYLARSLSAMYALHGAIVLFVSLDIPRYLPVIRILLLLGILFGIGLLILDFVAGMPLWWTVSEGPFIIVLGSVMLWLAGRVSLNDRT